MKLYVLLGVACFVGLYGFLADYLPFVAEKIDDVLKYSFDTIVNTQAFLIELVKEAFNIK